MFFFKSIADEEKQIKEIDMREKQLKLVLSDFLFLYYYEFFYKNFQINYYK